jgi:REP element-mobilizing transposase RayT
MPYNPIIHHRRSIRLKGYDYSQAGLYFVTICCQDKICRFGEIKNKEMVLNENGEIAYNEWVKLQKRYPHVSFDVFQIIPNHIHGIIPISK